MAKGNCGRQLASIYKSIGWAACLSMHALVLSAVLPTECTRAIGSPHRQSNRVLLCQKVTEGQAATTSGATARPGEKSKSDAHQQSGQLTTGELATILRESNEKYRGVKVIGSGPDVTVLSDAAASATEQDLKIDAVFLSKALVDAAPAQIERVKVLFAQHGPEGKFIVIPKKAINEYGTGKISPTAFLGGLHLEEVKPEETPTVIDGPQMERRLLIWQRIEKLRSSGTGVEPFEQLFDDAESTVKSGATTYALNQKLAFIETKLGEQEEQVALAKKTAIGHGITSEQGRSFESGGNKGQKRVLRFDELISTQEGKNKVRNFYYETAPRIMMKLKFARPDETQKLNSMKQEIDAYFARGREDLACQRIFDFFREARMATEEDYLGRLLKAESEPGWRNAGAGAGGGFKGPGPNSGPGPILGRGQGRLRNNLYQIGKNFKGRFGPQDGNGSQGQGPPPQQVPPNPPGR